MPLRALAVSFLLLSAAARGQEWQDLAEIQRTGEAFVAEHTRTLPGRAQISVTTPDPRTRLPRCTQLEGFLGPGVKLWGTTTVGVRCLQPHTWSLFLPVSVKVMADVVVTAQPVTRGHALSAADVRLQNLDLSQLPAGVFTDPQQVIGKVTVAALPGAFVLKADQLRAAYVVTYGQVVRIVFRGEGFRVSSEGRALGNAGIGEMVQVRSASGKVIKAMVQEPGVVEVR
jgi:flagella basal body P-ring formation protein FlgA